MVKKKLKKENKIKLEDSIKKALKLKKISIKGTSSEKTLKGFESYYNKYKSGDKTQINLFKASW